ncbi:MATH and LRR domain-containing protein PFE0570w-like [Anoplophora glabripennis]|uniref:MATH and LRR domain-containing protein PFE0570w-like n=1 Tax=Anoplophora glabripennis TaxID=217634 RepID=UPI00087474FF|nr:MATH and LRR domain-containing protein PFE0570w-like [Anoplophora glabripennis]
MEEESFQLLSSMSPNVKHCQKHFRKGTTVLALRKSLQKSSIYDKSIHTGKNDKLVLTETGSTCTSKSTESCEKLLNTTPISIHDSDSENEFKFNSNKSKPPELVTRKKKSSTVKKNLLLSQDKFQKIKHWVDNVNIQCELKDTSIISAYSELSTIYGEDNGGNFITERTGRAVNSTSIDSTSVHFDELFKQKIDYIALSPKDFINIDKPPAVNESFIKQHTSLTKNIQRNEMSAVRNDFISNFDKSVTSSYSKGTNHKKSLMTNVCNINNTNNNHIQTEISECDEDINDSDNSFSLIESLNTRLLKGKNQNISAGKSQVPYNSSGGKCSNNKLDCSTESNDANQEEIVSMLDDLYGNKWREKEEYVLLKTPKTEPKKRVLKPNNLCITNSERKPKLSVLYKNPYLETEKSKSNNLLRTLQKSRLKFTESPAIKRLKDLCDSDTDSNSDVRIKLRAKLNFDDSDGEEDTTSKYFRNTVELNKKTVSETECESDKENLDNFSFIGQSLEERLQSKINRIKDISGGKRKEKNENSNDKIPLLKRCDTNSKKTDRKIDNSSKKEEKKTDNRKLSSDSSSSDDTWEEEVSKIVRKSEPVNGKYSFLASLSANIPILQCDMSARIYRNNFKLYKEQLLTKLFTLYNEKIFENAIPQDTVLEWNDRMRGTAGFCYCKKITRRTGTVERAVRIVLSTKVIDAAYRLRDTLIHEMCHAATWLVNCVSDGHGRYWKSWACKAMKTFPELPPIKTCHDYVINTKYTYKCTGCGYSIGRHSKSLDIERKRCGYCLGKFEILLNKVSKKGETKSVPATPKKEATGFALFVKENYGVYKQTNLKHGEVMKLLGQKFQEMKLKTN